MCDWRLWLTSTGAGIAPSRDQTGGAGTGTARGQGHGFDVAVQGGGLAQLDQHDVVIQVVAVVALVTNDPGRADELLSALIDSNVVLTKAQLDASAGRARRGMYSSKVSTCLVSMPFYRG